LKCFHLTYRGILSGVFSYSSEPEGSVSYPQSVRSIRPLICIYIYIVNRVTRSTQQQTEILFRSEDTAVVHDIIYSIIIIVILSPSLRLRPVSTAKPMVVLLRYRMVQYTRIISVIALFTGVHNVRACAFYTIFWRGRDGLTNGLLRVVIAHSSPHTCKLEMAKNTHTSGSSVKVSAGGDGHTRRLIPMANRKNFTILLLFSYVSLSCCGSRDCIILYYSHDIIIL